MVLLRLGGPVVLSPRRPALRRGLAVALAAGGLAVAGQAVAGQAVAEDAPDPAAVAAPDAPRQPAPIGAVQPEQAETLRVLRRPQRADDALPADALAAAGPNRFGRNPELARAVRTATGTGWVVPGDGTVCLVVPDPVDGYATSCAPTGVVATDGLTVGLADEDDASATTLTPDGATVAVQDDEGRRTRIAPDASGVTRVEAQEADHLEIHTPAGRSDTPLLDAGELAAGAAG